MHIQIDAEDIKDDINPQLSVQLGDPAWSAYNADGTPASGAIPIYDDGRLTQADVIIIITAVEADNE